jgi:hypothetical protein
MIVIAAKYGQLGNRLFVFAHFIAFAMERGQKVANLSFEEYAGFFQATKDDLFCRYPGKPSPLKARALRGLLYGLVYRLTNSLGYRNWKSRLWGVVRIDEDEYYDLSSESFVSLAESKKFILTQGWMFRDKANFFKHADAIRLFFRPVEEVQNSFDALIERARDACDVLVGVHIRQGDYRNFMEGKYFYEADEYIRLMKKIEQLFGGKRVRFLVCSNTDLDRKIFEGLDFTFGSGQVVEDMYSLARCDYIAGPPSTYTLWASFYSKVPLYMVEDPARGVAIEDFIPERSA